MPLSVVCSLGSDMVDGFFESRVGLFTSVNALVPEVVQNPEDIVMPSIGVREAEILLVGWLVGGQTSEEMTLQKILLA